MVSEKKIRSEEFQYDMSRYLDKKSKSSYRFLNLHDVYKEKKKDSLTSDVVILREKTQLERFLENISSFFKSKKKKEDLDEIHDGEDVTEKLTDSEDEILETTDDDEVEVEDEPTDNRSWFARIFGLGSKEEDYEEEIDEELIEETPEYVDDMRVIALFAKDLLKKIPHKAFLELKESGRLVEFKERLKKHGLIKE